jgi:hypothetical protein
MQTAREGSESKVGSSRWLQAGAVVAQGHGQQTSPCLHGEATGRHSLGVALALHDAGHVVSVVNSAQIRDFARTKLGRDKTDWSQCCHRYRCQCDSSTPPGY